MISYPAYIRRKQQWPLYVNTILQEVETYMTITLDTGTFKGLGGTEE